MSSCAAFGCGAFLSTIPHHGAVLDRLRVQPGVLRDPEDGEADDVRLARSAELRAVIALRIEVRADRGGRPVVLRLLRAEDERLARDHEDVVFDVAGRHFGVY